MDKHDPENDVRYAHGIVHEYSLTGMHRVRIGKLVGAWADWQAPAEHLDVMALTEYFGVERVFYTNEVKKL